ATQAGVFLALVGLCAVARVLPHPPNFTPLAGAALLASLLFGSRLVACAVPILAMLASDAWIGGYELPTMVVVYGSLVLPVLLRPLLSRRQTMVGIGLSATICSIAFFASTNFAVWMFGGIYPVTLGGLVECYTAALPFFKYTLAGDLFWSLILLNGYRWAVAGHVRPIRLARTATAPTN
ncbi:MAG TPA: DUF6580 family putative transport protein, partial [Pirellulales bacterium]|nr:DUF6580 family putative transport protein [Pirellulales bacterium]